MFSTLKKLLTLCFAFAFFLTFAQENEVIYQAIEISEIPDYNAQTRNRVLEINQLITDSVEFSQLKNDYDTLLLTFNNYTLVFDSVDSRKLTLVELNKWSNVWNGISDEMQGIYIPLKNKESEYLELYNELNYTYHVILETILETKKSSLPEHVKENLNETKKIVRELRNTLKNKHSVYLAFKSDCNQMGNEIFLQQSKLKTAKDNIMKNLLVPEQPVLWKAISQYKKDTLSNEFADSPLTEYKESVKSYVIQEKGTLLMMLLLVILFIGLFYFIKFKAIKFQFIKDLGEEGAMRVILFQPIIAGFIFAWMFILIAFELPNNIKALWGVLMIPVVIYLLIELFGKQPLLSWIIFLFFYVFRNVEFILISSTPYSRLIYILVSIFILVVIIRITRRRFKNIKSSVLKTVIHLVFNILILLLISTIIFNIAGNVILSHIILVGSIEVVLSGILLSACFVVLEAFVRLLLVMPKAQYSNIIKNYSSEIKKTIRKILILIFVFVWVNISLKYYDIHAEVVDWLTSFFTTSYNIGNISFSLGNVFAFFITIFLTVQISKGVRVFLNEEVFERSHTSKGSSGTIILLARFTITSLGFLIALAIAGIGIENITIIIGALGVGIGFGLQNIFNNLISGLILAFERPIKVDDIIQVGDLMGVVKDIGFRSSTIRTYDGSEVIVPNGDILSNQMINWTLSDRRKRLRVELLLSMETKPEDVISLLNEVAEESDDMLKTPAPRPRFIGYHNGLQNYQFLFWIANLDNSFGAGTAIMLHIHNKLIEKGIKVPYPQQNIRIVDESGVLTEE